ncbi:MAG: hypothetical protein ACPGLV_03525, partial [Bacteroidia bacterium]
MKRIKIGAFAFFIVLLLMPLGHTLMVLLEHIFQSAKFISAGAVGFLGLLLLSVGVVKQNNKNTATMLGLLGGVLVWTGWIEFSFVWIAQRLEIQPLIENGEIATKPEYLVMMSSVGLLSTFGLYYLFNKSNCQFFGWIQRKLGFSKYLNFKNANSKPVAVTTFIELIMVIWTFYLVLLFVYDNEFAGDKHPLTYFVAFGSLFWAAYLIKQLIKIQKFDYAIRYAIPTVVIFWNFVEILGRWDMFKEIWVHPAEH